jgi:hypothetical protein
VRVLRHAPDLVLGAVVLAWAGVRLAHADAELNARPVVSGPFRTWGPPEAGGPFGGEVIDPRPTGLADELAARYGLRAAPPLAPTARGAGDGSVPRLIFPAPGEALLVVGSWGGDLVVFAPGVGVTVVDPDRVPADVPAHPLDVPRERVF